MNLHFDFLSPVIFQGLVQGMYLTIKITLIAILTGIVFGTLLALLRLSPWRPVRAIVKGYVNLFRSLPLAMVLLGFYLVVPQFLKALIPAAQTWDTRMASALIAFSLFEAAYYSEIIRAGLQSVPRGQFAAASSLGMRPMQTMFSIILPQAFRRMLPVILTQVIILFQDTSLVYVISLTDFFTTAENVGERDNRMAEMMLIAGGVYFVICLCASRAVQFMSRRNAA